MSWDEMVTPQMADGEVGLPKSRSPQGPDMSVFGLERELLELLQYRDDVAEEVHVTEDGRAEQAVILEATDFQITEYVKRQTIARADSVLGVARELSTRVIDLRTEARRLHKLADITEGRLNSIKHGAAEAIAATVDPTEIVAATQGTIIKRVKGKLGQLKLCKSPGSVEVTDMSLLPESLQSVTVTMPLQSWDLICKETKTDWGELFPIAKQPDKRAIVAVLKSHVPCEKCDGNGVVEDWESGDGEFHRGEDPCSACDGSGTVPGTVPGARLISDSVHLRLG